MKRVWLVWAGEDNHLIDAYDNKAAADARADRLNRHLAVRQRAHDRVMKIENLDQWEEAWQRHMKRFASLSDLGLELGASAWVASIAVRSK